MPKLSPPSPNPSVAVIVLNWNGLQDTLACLESLSHLDYPAYQVILVDNASSDGTVAAVRQAYPLVRVIEAGGNLGFTGGNNLGLRAALQAGCDFALLLNNDTEVAPDFLRLLVEAVAPDPGVGMAGPMIYYHSHPDLIWSAGGRIAPQKAACTMLGLGERDEGQFGRQPYSVDYVTGCAVLVRRSVLEQVGLLDERFFMYYEEVEWCYRTRQAGYRILALPYAKIWHKLSPQAREESPFVHYMMTRNRLLWIRAARLGWLAWWRVFLLDDLRTLLSWSLRPKWKHKRRQRNAMALAMLDFMRARYGYRRLPG